MAKEETIKTVKKALDNSKDRNFNESVELAINLKDVDLSIPKNRIDEEIILPRGRGKVQKVAIFGSGELAMKAKNVADTLIQPEELEDLGDDKRKARTIANEHDFFIAEAPMMPTIGRYLGVVLGPRGKMPKPMPPGGDPEPIVNNLKNSVRVRSKDKMTFHVPVGTRKMDPDDIAENIDTIIKRVAGRLERGMLNIKSAYVKTTMGPSEQLEVGP